MCSKNMNCRGDWPKKFIDCFVPKSDFVYKSGPKILLNLCLVSTCTIDAVCIVATPSSINDNDG